MSDNKNQRWDDQRVREALTWGDEDKAEPTEPAAAPGVRTWRQRIGVGQDWPLHAPNDVERAMVAEIAELRLAAAKAEAPAPAPEWGLARTVADVVRNLLTLDQADPIYSAFFLDFDGKRRCRTLPVTISRERVIDGKWVDSTRKDVPYATVVWARPDERAQQAAAPGALELLNADELTALRRFNETCQDGEGYDVRKEMMQRLAAIGVVRRTSGSYYETTEFGLRVLDQRAPCTPEAPADKHLPGWERGIPTVTLTGHQLREALDFVNPDGDDDVDQRDDWLTFGIVQHKDDAGIATIGLCCWNDDSEGVLPLDEYPRAAQLGGGLGEGA